MSFELYLTIENGEAAMKTIGLERSDQSGRGRIGGRLQTLEHNRQFLNNFITLLV